MTWRQNLHYKIASQKKLKSDSEYIPNYSQIKLELSVEKGTKEGEAFQALQVFSANGAKTFSTRLGNLHFVGLKTRTRSQWASD